MTTIPADAPAAPADAPAPLAPAPEPGPTAEPDGTPDRPEPPASGGQTEPKAWTPTGRLAQPDTTNGVYVVLWAPVPSRKTERPEYREAAFVTAHNPARAKAIVIEADDQLGAFLREQAAVGKGILVRAVPAMHWPADVEPTTFKRPAPILHIG